MEKHKLKKKIIFSGRVTLKSGLHIGGRNEGLEIGGIDATILRNPFNNQPYIPGSSFKGKIRSLLEQVYGSFQEVRMGETKFMGPCSNPDDIITQTFGMAGGGDKNIASRLIVRDFSLNTEELSAFEKERIPTYSEVKTEVIIDRINASAIPRSLERVPAGLSFNLSMVLNIFSNNLEREKEMVRLILEGLELLQDDYLGGKGSRGSGLVKIKLNNLEEKEFNSQGEIKSQEYLVVKIPESLK